MNTEIDDLLIEMIEKHCEENYNDGKQLIDYDLIDVTRDGIIELVKNEA